MPKATQLISRTGIRTQGSCFLDLIVSGDPKWVGNLLFQSCPGHRLSKLGSVSSGRGGRGTHQKRWPHRLMTASFAVSRQMLHSKVLSCPPLSPAPLLLPLGPPALEFSGDAEAEGPLLAIPGCQQTLTEDSPKENPEKKRALDCQFLQPTLPSFHGNTPIFSQLQKFRL